MTSPQQWLTAGQAALDRADWLEAKRCFELAIEQAPSPTAHDGLGLALWWLNEIRASHRERTIAYQQFYQNRDTTSAAMVAMWLAREQIFLDGNVSAMKGWFARADRLLADQPHGIARVWRDLLRASVTASPEELEQIARHGLEAARVFRDDDLEAASLAFLGIAQVVQGRVEPGFAALDEALAAATGGAVSFTWLSEVFCLMLSACELAGDLERSEQWCQSAEAYTYQHSFPFLAATCRVTYGSVLTSTGKWDAAERELTEAIRAFEGGHVALRAQAVIKLAELRVWQGRLEEAEVLLTGYEDRGTAAAPMAHLALARGDTEVARAILVQQLLPDSALTLDKAPLLRLLVEVELAACEYQAANESAARLAKLAEQSGSDFLRAQADLAQAQVQRATGASNADKYIFAALERLRRYDQSLLAARARFELAQVTRHNDRAASITWARAALASFERLGAKHDADVTMSFLRELGAATPRRTPSNAGLTAREQEVLELLGEGMSNREIAARLVVSPKTIEHHVSQILSKLGARSRAEAAAIAARL